VEKQAPDLVVDVQGVGYEVQVSMNTYFGLPAVGEPVVLHTHFSVREDAQQLFGFASQDERLLFRHLIKVSGVGPKMALAILSGLSVADLVRCIRNGDVNALTRAPGVGKKTAERLVVEMKDRLASWGVTDGVVAALAPAPTGDNLVLEEAESALIALGYKPQEASRMVAVAKNGISGELSSEALIRAALKGTMK
jgi:Holliday junction DNA helicase RuvA